VTGLGTVFVRDAWYKKIIVFLNRISFKNSQMIAFMNEDNERLYRALRIIYPEQNTMIVPGSGVNLDRFTFVDYPKRENIKFTFIARILKDKGIEEFLKAAEKIKTKFDKVEFDVVGFVDEEKYKKLLKNFQSKGIIKYLGKRDDIPKVIADSSCVVLPSFGEGRGTVLQEGASVGRPLITCNTYGCKDNVDEGSNGYLCEMANVQSLEHSMIKFINITYEEKVLMGRRGREKAENEFDRKIVVKSYIAEIKKIV
jgi:glycosyltransferase involved in cell wall biosynthesis